MGNEARLRALHKHSHAQTNNYEETARRLNVDRRTVKGRVDRARMEKFGTTFAGKATRSP